MKKKRDNCEALNDYIKKLDKTLGELKDLTKNLIDVFGFLKSSMPTKYIKKKIEKQ